MQLAEKCYRGLPPELKDPYSIPMSDAIKFFNNSSGEARSYLFAITEAKKLICVHGAAGKLMPYESNHSYLLKIGQVDIAETRM